MERLLDSLNSGCGIVCVIDNERCESRSRPRIGTKGELPGMFIMVSESVSGTYCGTLGIGGMGSRVIECRAADEDEGHCRWCLLVWLEWFDSDEAVLRRLDAPRRCGARGTLPKPDESPVRPTTLPISVEVRSMDMTPGPAEDRRSCLAGPAPSPAYLFVLRDMPEALEARLARPLPGPLGSLLESIVPLQTRECYSVRADPRAEQGGWCCGGKRARRQKM
jgi:hypothetical protein